MNLTTYEELTGTTVKASQVTLVTAQLKRSQKILEGMLGYSLNSKLRKSNLYIERGKADVDCSCPDVEPDELEEPDDVEYAYRLFPYNPPDKYLHVDPFTAIHSVKLVKDDVTYKTFTSDEIRGQYTQGWGKYIENCQQLCGCLVACNCVQLAVDADWLDVCKYDELMYLWSDMVTYYVDCKKDVRSETVGSHSYTKFDRKPPEGDSLYMLKKFAGPNGSLTKVLTI